MEDKRDTSDVSGWGKFQKRLSALLVLASIPNGFLTMIVVFTSATPAHRCRIPELDSIQTNISDKWYESNKYLGNATGLIPPGYIPTEVRDGKPDLSRCFMYNTTSYSLGGENVTHFIVGCQDGWIYERNDGKETAVTEWNIVCDKAWIKPIMSSSFVFGGTLASLTVGWLADRFGRRPLYLISMYLQFIFTLLCALSANVQMYGVTLFLVAYCHVASFMVTVVLGSEMLGPRMRTVVGNLEMAGFAVGYMVLPLLAYLTPTWRWLLITMACSGLLFTPYFWLIPESHRWLVQVNRLEEAEKLRIKISKCNGEEVESRCQSSRLIPEDDKILGSDNKESSQNQTPSASKQTSYLALIRQNVIRMRTLICLYLWFIIGVVYIFFSFNTENLGGNNYINCFLAAVVEIPASLVSLFLMNSIGRKPAFIALITISTAALALIPFLLTSSTVAAVIIAMVGKFAITAAYDGIFLYTPEMFPTMLRSKAVGACNSAAKLGGSVAPYIIFLGDQVGHVLPYMLMAVLTGITMLLILLLPETKSIPVPNTIEEAEKMKNNPSDIFILCKSKPASGEGNNETS